MQKSCWVWLGIWRTFISCFLFKCDLGVFHRGTQMADDYMDKISNAKYVGG